MTATTTGPDHQASAAATERPPAGLVERIPAVIRRRPGFDRIPPPERPWVFAVEHDSVQLSWRRFAPGPVRFRAADTTVTVLSDGGPGVVTLDHLPHDADVTIHVDGEGARRVPARWRALRTRTLRPPPGAILHRFATVSDLHIGSFTFGYRATMYEHPVPDEAHPVRCTKAALRDLTAWGAQLVCVKGDLTSEGRAKDWDEVGRILDDVTIPVELLPGNHDQYGAEGEPDPYDALLHLGHDLTKGYEHIDVPGLRIVLVDSTVRHRQLGHVAHLTDGVEACLRDTDLPAFVTMHHYAQRLPVPTFWPPGITSLEANPFLRRVIAAKPATVVSSGHTHRHRRRHVGPLVLTEVGSPKDYPGTWAGYTVFEGGIQQVVRRVSGSANLRWTDYSAAAALGGWGLWSPGLLAHRCFSHTWP